MKKLLTLLLIFNCAFGQLKIANIFTDHAVLQRNKPLPIWGWANSGSTVTLSLNQELKTATADQNGKWQVTFDAHETGGEYQLVVSTDTEKIKLLDLIFGDVWLLSGQSNMEWTVAQSDDFDREKANADFSEIRHILVEHEVSLSPKADISKSKWELASQTTFGRFSAIGFFFARQIYQKTKVPIGLVHSSWGGSQLEGWLSKDAMFTHPELKAYAQNLPANWVEADAFHDLKLRKQLLKSAKIPEESSYLKKDFDFSTWHKTDSPLGQWDWKGIWAFRGNGYMAKTFNVSEDMASKSTTLGLGLQDAFNEIYINGKLVFAGILKGQRTIHLEAGALNQGENKIIVKFGSMVEPSWYGLGINGSSADLYIKSQKETISLASDWYLMPAFADPHTYVHSSNNIGTSIFNGMIAPLLPFSIKGVLWYQGETNAGRAYQYRSTFPLLINDWRLQWKEELPFYFVQLATYGSQNDSNSGSNWAELREAQTMTLSLPKTGMAVTIDVGNPADIHPTNKQDVGQRLALIALKNDYGMPNVVASGPEFQNLKISNSKAIISFKNANAMYIKDKYGYLKGFEVAGEDRKFYHTKAELLNNTVVVFHPKNQKISAVRYAWSDAPVEANLFNTEGLPAVPFRTDKWPGITDKNKFD